MSAGHLLARLAASIPCIRHRPAPRIRARAAGGGGGMVGTVMATIPTSAGPAGPGDAEVWYQEGKRLLAQGEGGDAAGSLLAQAAAAGHGRAAWRLADLLLARDAGDGEGTRLLRQAAEAGVPEAQFRLGLLVKEDRGEALRWCRAAAVQGLGVAQYNLGLLLAAGEAGERAEAGRWMRAAALNGVAEAEAFLELAYAPRPRRWDDADTRASVALVPSGPDAAKPVRFADYYADPCLDLVLRQFRLDRDQAEDLVQQFFLEMEQPLERGEHRGRAWKSSLRERYDAGRGRFRPYLHRVIGNFARDWLRRRDRRCADGAPDDGPDAEALVLRHAEDWQAQLDDFVREAPPTAIRAAEVLALLLGAGLAQEAIAERLGVSLRTVKRDARLGADLLCDWLRRRAAAGHPAVDGGLGLLPQWLHHPCAGTRARALLLLAYLRRLGLRAGS
ncbi:MAG: hypothetical protein L6R48_00415 [Planctomycetes bacterium]|nr:hypothetical protein [Planctomycetota bacterium]